MVRRKIFGMSFPNNAEDQEEVFAILKEMALAFVVWCVGLAFMIFLPETFAESRWNFAALVAIYVLFPLYVVLEAKRLHKIFKKNESDLNDE